MCLVSSFTDFYELIMHKNELRRINFRKYKNAKIVQIQESHFIISNDSAIDDIYVITMK